MIDSVLHDLLLLAVQSKNWVWGPGMRVTGPDDRTGTISGFKTLRVRSYVDVAWDDGKVIHTKVDDLTPIITAAPTRGIVLELTRRAWNCPALYVGPADGWYVSVPDFESPSFWRVIEGATEEEAVLRAFLAAPIGFIPVDDQEPSDE